MNINESPTAKFSLSMAAISYLCRWLSFLLMKWFFLWVENWIGQNLPLLSEYILIPGDCPGLGENLTPVAQHAPDKPLPSSKHEMRAGKNTLCMLLGNPGNTCWWTSRPEKVMSDSHDSDPRNLWEKMTRSCAVTHSSGLATWLRSRPRLWGGIQNPHVQNRQLDSYRVAILLFCVCLHSFYLETGMEIQVHSVF
jgi:hypothetical protein